ncbi:hypothetical protein G3N57_21560 [Paraburkholderia sp. Se-20369]|nr:hypothetical protein [Paraburkholderia sp. Se-20369]
MSIRIRIRIPIPFRIAISSAAVATSRFGLPRVGRRSASNRCDLARLP